MEERRKQRVAFEIRRESPQDVAAIRELTDQAFKLAKHSGGNEAAIVDGLRVAGQLSLSLVAIIDEAQADALSLHHQCLIGHVALSPVTVDGVLAGWYGLGPISVHPGVQNRGIGSGLVREGLRQLEEDGANGCTLLGNPQYYRRFGFRNDERLTLEGVPAEDFMALQFGGGATDNGQAEVQGVVKYHDAFHTPATT